MYEVQPTKPTAVAPRTPLSAPVPLAELVAPPEGLELYDVDQMQEMLDDAPLPRATFPAEPLVPALAPPSSGGGALELADLALIRGDPLDAAAQYRALLPRLEPSAAAYANLRLAQAYLRMGDRERARDVLYGIAGSRGPVAWAALIDLADLRAGEIGARDAFVELMAIAGDRRELLADHMIRRAPEHEAAELLIDKATRLHRCDYAHAALKLDLHASLDTAPSECREELAEARRNVAGHVYGRQYLDFFRKLNPFVERWDAIARAALDGNRDAEPWVAFAEDLASIRPLATTELRVETVDRIARSALLVALELSLASDRRDVRFLPRIRVLADMLGSSDRRLVLDRIDAW